MQKLTQKVAGILRPIKSKYTYLVRLKAGSKYGIVVAANSVSQIKAHYADNYKSHEKWSNVVNNTICAVDLNA